MWETPSKNHTRLYRLFEGTKTCAWTWSRSLHLITSVYCCFIIDSHRILVISRQSRNMSNPTEMLVPSQENPYVPVEQGAALSTQEQTSGSSPLRVYATVCIHDRCVAYVRFMFGTVPRSLQRLSLRQTTRQSILMHLPPS